MNLKSTALYVFSIMIVLVLVACESKENSSATNELPLLEWDTNNWDNSKWN